MRFGHGRVNSTNSKAEHTFASVPSANIPRSSFNRSHGYKTTFNEGYLIPIYVDEVLPGDTFNLKLTAFARMATPTYPLMDNLYLDTHFFFVPNRLIWNNWQKMCGEQAEPDDTTDYVVPTITAPAVTGVTASSLFDYLGVPTEVASITFCALFSRAYNLIYNEWFRDQNLQNSVVVDKDDGPDTYTDYVLLRRGKRHDYFTSALPWPQKINDGSTLNVPLSGTAPVTGIGKYNQVFSVSNQAVYETGTVGTTTYPYSEAINIGYTEGTVYIEGSAATGGYPQIYADLSEASGITINALRESFQIQKMFERDARGGTRYTEIIRSHFGVVSPDARLQRPEFLGGGSAPVIHNPIPQTSETTVNSPQGNLAAYSTASIHGHGFVKSFVEHGVIIGLASVRADLNYQQGLNRMFSRSTRYDFYWPALSHLGEQAILNKEIYIQGNANDDLVFGYQERHAEYRYKPGLITGQFRSNYATSLDAWHLAQDFGSLPTLNSTFIVENAPMARVLEVDDPHFILDAYFALKCARPMPVYSVPGLIDHF
jgi:hypothetical protein